MPLRLPRNPSKTLGCPVGLDVAVVGSPGSHLPWHRSLRPIASQPGCNDSFSCTRPAQRNLRDIPGIGAVHVLQR